jgi:hypothetical protein
MLTKEYLMEFSDITIDNKNIKKEALELSELILKDIELSQLSLDKIALKASRLAHLLMDIEYERIFQYEAGGYPTTPTGINPVVWKYLIKAKRIFQNKDNEGTIKEYGNTTSIMAIEQELNSAKTALSVSQDPNISIQPANPNQYVYNPVGNAFQRKVLVEQINKTANLLANRQSFIYEYAKNAWIELKFSSVLNFSLSSFKDKTNKLIAELVPDEAEKISAILENLNDITPEKWSLALTSCRRLLKSLADKLYPSSNNFIEKNGKKISITDDKFINRLMLFITDNADAETLCKITNSNLDYIGNRLDAINDLSNKGVHSSVSKDEAERCFLYTYMVISDILSIKAAIVQNK